MTVCHTWGYEVDNVTEFHSTLLSSFYTVITCVKISLCSLMEFMHNYLHNYSSLHSAVMILSCSPKLSFHLLFASFSIATFIYRIEWLTALLFKPLLSTVEMESARALLRKSGADYLLTCFSSVCMSPCALELRELAKRCKDANFTHLIFMERMWRPSRYN